MLGMRDFARLAHERRTIAEQQHIAKQPSFLQRIWRGSPSQTVTAYDPLLHMLKAAVAAAEASLETSISSVAVSVYETHFPMIEFEEVKLSVESALDTLGLYRWTRCTDYGYHLIPALGMEGYCSDGWTTPGDPNFDEDPPHLVLTLDYTRASMTAGLWDEDCGVVEMLSWTSFRISGPFNRDRSCEATKGEDDRCASEIYEHLRMLCIETMETVKICQERWPLSAVLITGERADDKAMTAGLRRFLQDNFKNGSSMPLSGVQEYAPDPVFAASRAASGFERVLKVALAEERDERSEL